MRIPLLVGLLALTLPAAALAQNQCATSCTTGSTNLCSARGSATQACLCTVSPRWQGVSTVKYQIFNHAAGIPNSNISLSQAQTTVAASFNSWNAIGTPLTVTFDRLSSYSSPSQAANGNDNLNTLVWIDTGWTYGSGTLGVTTPYFYTGTNQIIDADIEFNAQDWGWTTSSNPPQGELDMQSIVTHEGGHFWGAIHTPDASSVMYYAYSGGAKRTLTSDDKAQMTCLYPGSGSAKGGVGASCATKTDCQTGLVCAKPLSGTSTAYVCATACSPGSSVCAAGESCGSAASSPAGTNNACFAAATGPSDLCSFCQQGGDCTTGLCIGAGTYSFCSGTCSGASACGTGFACYNLSSGGTACAPSSADHHCPTPQCGAGKSCPAGFSCDAAGMCVSSGSSGSSAACGTCDGTKPCPTGYDCVQTGASGGYTCHKQCTSASNCSNQLCRWSDGAGSTWCACDAEVAGRGQACVTSGPGKICGAADLCASANGQNTCLQKCSASSPCPAGSTCAAVTGGSACVPNSGSAADAGSSGDSGSTAGSGSSGGSNPSDTAPAAQGCGCGSAGAAPASLLGLAGLTGMLRGLRRRPARASC